MKLHNTSTKHITLLASVHVKALILQTVTMAANNIQYLHNNNKQQHITLLGRGLISSAGVCSTVDYK